MRRYRTSGTPALLLGTGTGAALGAGRARGASSAEERYASSAAAAAPARTALRVPKLAADECAEPPRRAEAGECVSCLRMYASSWTAAGGLRTGLRGRGCRRIAPLPSLNPRNC